MKCKRRSKTFSIALPLAALLPWVILAWLLLGSVAAAETPANGQKKVLVIYSSRQDAPYTALIENACRKTLSEGLAGRLDYYPEYVDLGRFSSPEYKEALRDFLRQKYAGLRLDVIIAEGNAPLEFVSRYGAEIFPGVPLVFSTEEGDLRPIPNSTGLVFKIDMKSTLELALRLQPNTKRVFVVSGASDFDKFYEQDARQQFREYEERVTITYLPPMTLKDLLQETSRLPKDSIIYFVSMFEDGAGEKYIPVDVLDKLSPAASVTVYCWPEMTIDHGIVGGNLLSEENVAQQTAGLALRVLRGESPDRIPVAKIRPYVNVFNWRQLRRWGISEDRLPPGSIVRFKELTTWEQYKGRIIIVVAIIIFQTLLLASLLVERGRNRRNAHRLARSEERFAKAFKANPQPMSVSTLAEGRYLDVNDSFLRMSGYTRDEVIGHTSNELRNYENPADRKALLIEPLLRSGVVRNFELNFRPKHGAFRTLLSSAELLELGGDKCILVASSDITERKELEQELQRSEREFSTLVENSPDVIARLDLNLRYIYISPGLERATGILADRFIGKTVPEVALDSYDWQSFEATCREAINTRQATSRAFDFGGRHYWTRVIPEFAAEGMVESVMTISEDVTDRIRAQQELLQLTGQLFRSQDEERRRIARELHDGTAQNLFGISVNLAKLNQLSHDKPEAKQLINECETLGNESLQEIRTLSYLLHPPLLDEAGLVSALKWSVQGFTKRSGIYVDVFAPAMDRLPGEVELALFRIVQEALTNVRRHSGSGTASIRLEKKPSEVVLEIQDKGRGMPATKKSNKPSDFVEMGVGIPGMRQRLVQLGGKLEVSSNSDGTTIAAVVPLTNGVANVENPARGRS